MTNPFAKDDFDVVRLDKMLRCRSDDVAVYRAIANLFQFPPHVKFDWDGHIFAGTLRRSVAKELDRDEQTRILHVLYAEVLNTVLVERDDAQGENLFDCK